MFLDVNNDNPVYWFKLRLMGFGICSAIAFCVVCTLLLIEHYLIHDGRKGYEESPSINLVDFVRTKQNSEVQTKKRENKPPPQPDEMPPDMPQLSFDLGTTQNVAWSMEFDAAISADISTGTGFAISDGNYLPLVKVEPVYPRRALQLGLAGWVLVEFTVTRNGTIKDPFVVDNCATVQVGPEVPVCNDNGNNIFDRSALNAAMKFRYKPKIVDGEPIETAGVRNLITFELDG